MTAQKIAFATQIDGETLAETFGTAPKAVVITVQDGREVAREVRNKPYHEAHDHPHHGEHGEQDPRHDGPGANFAVITDCDALITRKIGPPGIGLAREQGIALYVVRAKTVEESLKAYLEGKLVPQADAGT